MKRVSIFACAILISTAAYAGMVTPFVPTVERSDKTETVFSFGLRFSFGDMAPEIVGAVRNTTTDKNSDVTGIQGDVSVGLDPNNGGKVKVRVLGLAGDRDALGQAGAGYDFGSNGGFLSVGVQGENIEGGLNVGANGMFDPYVGANTFGRPTGPKTKVTTPVIIIPPSYM